MFSYFWPCATVASAFWHYIVQLMRNSVNFDLHGDLHGIRKQFICDKLFINFGSLDMVSYF